MARDKFTAKQKKIMFELGEYIEKKMVEKESHLKQTGKLDTKRMLSRTELAKRVGVSPVWMSAVINGEKVASDELLLNLARYLEIDEDELFRKARKVHPDLIEELKKDYLGDKYIEGLDW